MLVLPAVPPLRRLSSACARMRLMDAARHLSSGCRLFSIVASAVASAAFAKLSSQPRSSSTASSYCRSRLRTISRRKRSRFRSASVGWSGCANSARNLRPS